MGFVVIPQTISEFSFASYWVDQGVSFSVFIFLTIFRLELVEINANDVLLVLNWGSLDLRVGIERKSLTGSFLA